MAKVFYLHWHEAEGKERVAALAAAGHEVSFHWSMEVPPKFGDSLPEIVVISLDRLPSHGRRVAEWFWEAKKRQHIPLVFAGGKPDKVSAAKEQFPGGVCCATEEVPKILARLLDSGAKQRSNVTRKRPV